MSVYCPSGGSEMKTDLNIYTASWLLNPGIPPLSGGGLAVYRGRILETGRASDLVSRYGCPAVEFPGCVIMPGFVNAHTHLSFTDFPAWSSRVPEEFPVKDFTDWILRIVKVRRQVTMEETVSSVKNGINQLLASGTTAAGDIITCPETLTGFDGSQLKGRLYLELIGQEKERFDPLLKNAIKAARGIGNPRLPGLSAHAPYTLNSTLLPDIASVASADSLPLSLHLAESPAETELLYNSSGPFTDKVYPVLGWMDYLPQPRRITPVGFFDQGGLLGRSTLAIHCVHVSAGDAAILKERGTTVCLCPRSNQWLDVGTAPVALFKKLRIPLCLGTDSLASNDSLSLWDEIRFALDAYSGQLSPDELLQMATTGGATGIGLSDSIGSLTADKYADFQVIETGGDCSASSLLEKGRLVAVAASGVFQADG
jgi:aminodeoxyfutalosine deaminase